MLNRIVDVIRAGLPESAPPQAAAALSQAHSAVVLGSRWEGRVVYALFAPRGRVPAVVVKADTHPDYQPRLRQEHDALVRAAASPAMAGLAPLPLGVHQCGDAVVMAQTALPGTPLNVVLRRRFRQSRRLSARDHARVLTWLNTFHGSVSEESVIISPAVVLERLAQALPSEAPGAEELTRWVSGTGADLGALTVPVRPLHGDLAPSNCFVHRGRVRVVDWEGEVAQGPPLAEVLVFLNHYARAIPGPDSRLRDPQERFLEAFSGQGWLNDLTWDTWRRQLRALGLPEEAAEYLLVATLADLAAGQAPTAHAKRSGSRHNWSGLLALYAEQRQTASVETASHGGARVPAAAP
ncbi:aminoglycoside phosphotransferase family protein [Nocardiopsis exhalans]|uniref:Aminoglycoside phosphotransferase family protein n=1 Tax=Nocardiopsis exhalans TaxID=163604 RepID=A0ABY5D2L0_9ACTN|nr:aminoglycoside phosphotransferase family protein [Nocardiopsis exhalans]USY17427.1 aminoglycoside phosphotransferase family protein [Nocardiopsis exhalans]